jgi:alpha-amylase/alpha-mannosidase (GH57 family)
MRYLLQHWHFYQPRNNDYWTRIINENCYKPNSLNDILGHVSFNVGPTLMDWLNKNDPETLKRIIGFKENAIAQTYNHRIMPLIKHDEDLETQIIWGKKHFKNFFKKEPEGMWLPETATNKRVCKELVKQGIKYTIGAPWQKAGEPNPTKPYKISLGNNQEIIYFFYNEVSGLFAFDAYLDKTCRFLDNADKAVKFLDGKIKDNEILLMAYDGETFGTHHKFADKWAAYFPSAAKKIDNLNLITLDQYLHNFQVTDYSDIIENTAWSCQHNLERWTKGCKCAGGNQAYQEPLLTALEEQELKVHEIFEDKTNKYFWNIWKTRNDYIDLKLGKINENQFFRKHLKSSTSLEKKNEFKQLFEAEYLTQLSFTSCGWYFPEMNIQSLRNMQDAYLASAIDANMRKKLLVNLHEAEDWKDNLHVTGRELLENKKKSDKWFRSLYGNSL